MEGRALPLDARAGTDENLSERGGCLAHSVVPGQSPVGFTVRKESLVLSSSVSLRDLQPAARLTQQRRFPVKTLRGWMVPHLVRSHPGRSYRASSGRPEVLNLCHVVSLQGFDPGKEGAHGKQTVYRRSRLGDH